MENNSTISIHPIPEDTTAQKIRHVLHAFSIKNVHIDGNTAYVQFSDSSDLQTIQIKFDNQRINQLNNAKIDVPQNFNWNSIKKEQETHKKSSNDQSQKHQDLTSADLKNLIVISNCDKNILKQKSIEDIRKIFSEFSSVNRILKKQDQVIVEFLEHNDIQLLKKKFGHMMNVRQLGRFNQISRADQSNLNPDEFTEEWSKVNAQQSQLTQATRNQHLQEEKPSNDILHYDIVPPFDKKTSMQVNFLNEQSKLGYDNEANPKQPIHEASTKQQLGFASEEQLPERFDVDQKEKSHTQAATELNEKNSMTESEFQSKKQEEKQLLLKFQEQRLKKAELAESSRKQQQQETRRKQSALLMDQDFKTKMNSQRERLDKEQAQRSKQPQPQHKNAYFAQKQEPLEAKNQQLGYHEPPTQSQQAQHQANFLKYAGGKVGQQLGYAEHKIEEQLGKAVNKAKQESANLLNTGLGYLRDHQVPENKPVSTSEDKWNVRPESVVRPLSGTRREISKTIITVTLAIWVLFLLLQ